MQIKLTVLLLLSLNINAFYEDGSKVVTLTKDNFDDLVLKSDELWLVEFYAPWCGHCKTLAPEYEKAAKALSGVVRLGAVDMTQEQSVGSPYDIKGYPTVKVFGSNKNKPTDYNGERNAKGIVDQMVSEVRKIANERLGGKTGSSSGSGSNSGSNSGSGSCSDSCSGKGHDHSHGSAQDDHAGGDSVVVLTGENFHDLVDQDGTGWMVIFYAPWCGHCKSALPEWSGAAEAMKKEKLIKFGMINCDDHKSLCGEYGVKGYPSIKWFANGSNEDYSMGRDKTSFINFVESKKEFVSPPKPLQEMVSQDIFNEACVDNDGGLCVIAFFSSIRDSGVEKRIQAIAEIEEIKSKHKGKPLNFLWSEGGANFDLEDSFGLGFGFPAILAIHHGKKKYAVMRTHYSSSNIDKFIIDLMVGRVAIQSFYQIPKIKTRKAWEAKAEEI